MTANYISILINSMTQYFGKTICFEYVFVQIFTLIKKDFRINQSICQWTVNGMYIIL